MKTRQLTGNFMGMLEFGLGDEGGVPGPCIGSTGCCVGLLTEKGMWTCGDGQGERKCSEKMSGVGKHW